MTFFSGIRKAAIALKKRIDPTSQSHRLREATGASMKKDFQEVTVLAEHFKEIIDINSEVEVVKIALKFL